MQKFGINKYSNVPSVYGDNKLSFAKESGEGKLVLTALPIGIVFATACLTLLFFSDVMVSYSAEDHFFDLKQEILHQGGGTSHEVVRPMMVFSTQRKACWLFMNTQ